MSIPTHYFSGLSKKDTKKQIKELKKSRNNYKAGIYTSRSPKKSFKTKKSRHVVDFESRYGISITNLNEVSKVTGVKKQALQKIVKKGMGAFYSSGSRPNQSAHSWGYARLGSVLLKRNAYKIDKHILEEYNSLNIKSPNKNIKTKTKQMRGGNLTNKNKKYRKNRKNKSTKKLLIIDCKQISKENENKYNQCIRKSDGKLFSLPRKFSKTQCKNQRGFTMRSSCAIYR